MKFKHKKLKLTNSTNQSTECWDFSGITNYSKYWWIAFFAVVAMSCITRFHKVSQPDHVCWDETHFGKMASWYINRTFFFDVHPPLGKMLIAASGYLTGYNGTFSFSEPGAKFNGTNYLGMRMFCTALGAAISPFSFVTVWEMTKSLHSAILASAFILFDVGVITLTQYILLDPILLFFVMGAVMGIELVNSSQNRSFSLKWWFWLFFTGVMLGCALSVKFVGLFVILYVGLRTVVQLWSVLGDTSKSLEYSVQHFCARVVTLIAVPCVLYIGFFYIHLTVLNTSGNGDGFFSSAFQAQLKGNDLHEATAVRDVVYGSFISIKSYSVSGGYIHSHRHLYPEGIGLRHQQVTTYMHKDGNNIWMLEKQEKSKNDTAGETLIDYVCDGDVVRIKHLSTEKYLRATDEAAPASSTHFQVSGFEMDDSGNHSDIWTIVKDSEERDNVLHTITSKFKIVHSVQKCALTATRRQLPAWAYEQHELSCSPNPKEKDVYWNVEFNDHPSKACKILACKLSKPMTRISFKDMAPTFLERFLESHAVMIQGNAGLKPRKNEPTSKPWQWPINYKGIHFSEETENNGRIYLLGNPVIWASNLILFVIFVLLLFWDCVKTQRGDLHATPTSPAHKRFLEGSLWLFIGWALHYVPFWTMQRILYFHHYFTALLFSSMLSGITLTYFLEILCDKLVSTHKHTIFNTLFSFCYLGIVYSFYLFAPLTYGMGSHSDNPTSSMHNLRWMSSWEF